jgi:hypothetical protein
VQGFAPKARKIVVEIDPGQLTHQILKPDLGISPKASAFKRSDGTLESRHLEDMAPFLSREEVWKNMRQFDENDTLHV